jgi:hypothetical protein
MRRLALLALLALLAACACQTTLRFDSPDASRGGCASDRDCPLPSLHCEPSLGQCFACVADDDCASTAGRPLCDMIRRMCVQCATSQDCATGSVCRGQICLKTCAAPGDCATGTWCDDGVCVQCDDDFHCAAPRNFCDPMKFQCVACVTDAQCSSASSATPRCNSTTGTCVACLTFADCPGAAACDPTDGTCKTSAP